MSRDSNATATPAAPLTQPAEVETTHRHCAYCGEPLDSDDFLLCGDCRKCVHIKCLRNASTPGDLCGDVFFDFTCANCVQLQADACPSTSAAVATATASRKPREKFVRQHLPWLMIITLTLYNLAIKAKGLSYHGYFHWRTHIVHYIDKHWEYLFQPNTRRRKNWIGSVSGSLSHNSPQFFLSGQAAFNEPGWWKLTNSNHTPRFLYKVYEQLSQNRQRLRQEKRLLQDSTTSNGDSKQLHEMPNAKRMRHAIAEETDSSLNEYSCSRTMPYMGRKPKVPAKQLSAEASALQTEETPLNTVQSGLMDFLAENLGGGDDDFTILQSLPGDDAAEDCTKNELFSLIEHDIVGNCDKASFLNVSEIKEATDVEEALTELSGSSSDETSDSDGEDEERKPRIVRVVNFQELRHPQRTSTDSLAVGSNRLSTSEQIKVEVQSDVDIHSVKEESEEETAPVVAPKQSLFTRTARRPWPWLPTQTAKPAPDAPARVTLSEYEEKEMLLKLRKIFAVEKKCDLQIPSQVRRYYRKLCIRDWKRQHGKPLFNLDDYATERGAKAERKLMRFGAARQLIDRYQLIAQAAPRADQSFYTRIVGTTQYELFESPYTQRVLHPVIHRHSQCFPTWLKLMCEVQHAVDGVSPQRAPIDFCYVRPNHIAAVNALLQHEFWPGIDMSECLSYPDYSVVALYKKLVVGCGFLMPDVGYNEAYISFMAVRGGWQRSGIGTFMLYHLIQTCMTKDITLHVSATNPAVVLYQKFGFKIEEVILDFYEKYLPHNSAHSRIAFLLRLSR